MEYENSLHPHTHTQDASTSQIFSSQLSINVKRKMHALVAPICSNKNKTYKDAPLWSMDARCALRITDRKKNCTLIRLIPENTP